jgi:hypothetical protein
MFEKEITATLYPSGFKKGDSNFNSLSVLSDGLVYYTISSHDLNTHGRVYRFDPETGNVSLFADLGDVTGETGKKSLPQGKSHAPFMETEDKIYITTHYGYYQGNDGKEEPAPPPEGYTPYPGGKIIEYDKKCKRFTVLATAPSEEGIILSGMDAQRGMIYCLTWPKGIWMTYDIKTGSTEVYGQVSRGGEVGLGENYFCLCRMVAIDPRTGDVYFTNPDGEIFVMDYETKKINTVKWASMKKDIFGSWDPHKGGHQGYNWRSIFWHEGHRLFYGVHGKSGYLFTFDPLKQKLEVITRICNEMCIKHGMYELFRYGYMTLTKDPVKDNILHYISGFEMPDQKSKPQNVHAGGYLSLTTYDLSSGKLTDHGVIKLSDGRYPTNTQTIAVHLNGYIYTCPWIPASKEDGYEKDYQCDLIGFRNPIHVSD